MELILGLIGVVLVIGLIQEAINAIEWGRFFAFFIFGSIALGVLFSFTAEGVLVIIGAYAVLLVISIIFGGFRKIKKELE